MLYPLSYEGGRAELTGRAARRPPAATGSAQLGDHLREVGDVVVLHGDGRDSVLFAVLGQGVGHLAG